MNEELFDDNIKQLCAEIRAIVPLRFEQQTENSYNAEIEKKSGNPYGAVVWYYLPISLPKIAHELYHIKTGLLLGDVSDMMPDFTYNEITRYLLSHDYCQQFLNQTEHLIFYPYYKDQGYPEGDFYEKVIPEPYVNRLNEIEKSGLKKSNGKYVIQNVSVYMRLMVLFLFFPIDNRFSSQIHQLKHIDPDLFNIFKTHKKTISTIRIDPYDKNKLQNAYGAFLASIDNWTSNHSFDANRLLLNQYLTF